jgi:DNA-binding MarR family transcriptional regulator
MTQPKPVTHATPASEASKSGEALRQLVLEVFRLNGALLRHGAALTAPLAQTQARWQVIAAVAEATRTVPQIARRMGMSRQSVQRIADLLVADGVLRFAPNPDHARSPLVRLTPEGERVETRLAERGTGWAVAIADGLPSTDLERAVDLVRDIIRRLDT